MYVVQLLPDTELHPDQLLKIDEAEAGVAVSVMAAPFGSGAAQPADEPVLQLMPGPLTLPWPDPPMETVSG